MSQQPHPYRTNRDLFSNHYLTEHLRQTEPWEEVDQDEVREAYDEIREIWTDKQGRVADYNEAQLERNFIRPIFDILGIPFEIEETVMRNARRPDYGFFPGSEAADAAFDRDDFYEEAIAVADAKRWGRKLDTRGEKKRDFENPSYQIHAYLQETPPQCAVLTNGKQWRIYYGPTSHRLDSYYEIDLPELFEFVEEDGGIEDFKDFYLFFRQQAFLPDQSGDCFLDDVYDESSVFAEAIGEDLQNNIYEAIRVLAEGFLDTNDNLEEDDLPLIHDSSLIYLYRLIFILYAESEGRDLLPTDNDIYSESYSLNELKQTVADRRDETQQHYQTWQTNLWDRLEELFVLIDQGSQGKDIPKDQLYIPAYNGGLFRTSPDPDDSAEAQFLATHEADDAHLAEVIDLLTRRDADEGDGQVFVDYSSLDERHLGSIYEGLLEYKLDVANEPLTVEDGEYSPTGDGDEIEVEEGDVYLRTDAGERKATGSYYTPEYVVEYIVDETLGPLVDGIRKDLVGTESYKQGGFAGEFADRVFDLKVLDPAMGSGHFLVNAVDYLAREIIDAQERQDQQAVKRGDEDAISDPRTEEGELRDINWARRKVAQRCIYGVDLNPLATELAKVSLWLRTLAAEQPLAFLDHHLKTGNSLVGSDIEDVIGGDEQEAGQTQLSDWMDQARQRALEHVMERFTDLLSIDNETLEDIKEMEEVYQEVRDDPLYQRLLAMANVHTAAKFGLDIPDDAEEQMAEALRDNSWGEIEDRDWFRSAQAMADEESFFHWELEFPVAFYDDNGRRTTNAGFDAIIGNPPWMVFQKIDAQDREFQREYFEAATAKYDLYAVFIEKALQLLSDDGEFGYIVQNKFISANYGKYIKEIILREATVNQILDFEDANIFKGTTTYPLILQLTKEEHESFDYLHLPDSSPEEIRDLLTSKTIEFNEIEISRLKPNRAWIFPNREQQEVIDSLRTAPNVTEKEIFEISKSVSTNLKKAFLFEEKRAQIDIEDELLQSVVDGEDIHRYASPHAGKYLLFPYIRKESGELELVDIDKYPRAKSHLLEYEDELRDRRYYNKSIEEAGLEWYEYPHVKGNHHQAKILFPDISTTPEYTFDSEGDILTTTTAYAGVPEIEIDTRYLAAVLNSSALRFVFEQITPYLSGGYYRYQPQYVHQLPIALPDDTDTRENHRSARALMDENEEIQSEEAGVRYHQLIGCADLQRDHIDQRHAINLDLLDYLGNYPEGPQLPDVGLFQPTSSNILDTTTEEYEKLQVENVCTKRDGHSVTIEVTARYKPEDEDEFETDTWGYTETEYFEAFTLANLTDEEAALVEAFVPVAVEDEIGGFSDNATKTITLIDRLKDITLPDIDDVQADLQRYIETKERADELDEKIEKTDQLIDDIVYDLYDLTEEEIEIVEEALNSD